MARKIEYPRNNDENPFKTSLVGDAEFTVGADAGTTLTINVQLKDQWGGDLSERAMVDWVLFGDADGDTLATAATGVAAGTDGWVSQTVTGLRGVAGCESDGDLDIVITKSGAFTGYLGIRLSDGTYAISTVITMT